LQIRAELDGRAGMPVDRGRIVPFHASIGMVEGDWKSQVLAPAQHAFTETPLSSVPKMDPNGLDAILAERQHGDSRQVARGGAWGHSGRPALRKPPMKRAVFRPPEWRATSHPRAAFQC
jgi:hypothetical protein